MYFCKSRNDDQSAANELTNRLTRSVAGAKKADRTVYDIYGIAAEPNLPYVAQYAASGFRIAMARDHAAQCISDAKMLAFRFRRVLRLKIHPRAIVAKRRYILQQKCPRK